MIENLINQLLNFTLVNQILLTVNVPETLNINSSDSIQIIHNITPLGFGHNHNNAFLLSTQPIFCVLNPDIECIDDPFPELLKCLQTLGTALVSPLVISSSHSIEDSARFFPTLPGIFNKFIFAYDGRWPLDLNQRLNYPDWVAGMFMLFPATLYKQIGGFDQNYYLYYEDVDICRRIRTLGYQVALCTQVKVIHNAQRASRKNIKFLYWHVKSLCRYLFLKSK